MIKKVQEEIELKDAARTSLTLSLSPYSCYRNLTYRNNKFIYFSNISLGSAFANDGRNKYLNPIIRNAQNTYEQSMNFVLN